MQCSTLHGMPFLQPEDANIGVIETVGLWLVLSSRCYPVSSFASSCRGYAVGGRFLWS